jgi:hypothetical protein
MNSRVIDVLLLFANRTNPSARAIIACSRQQTRNRPVDLGSTGKAEMASVRFVLRPKKSTACLASHYNHADGQRLFSLVGEPVRASPGP